MRYIAAFALLVALLSAAPALAQQESAKGTQVAYYTVEVWVTESNGWKHKLSDAEAKLHAPTIADLAATSAAAVSAKKDTTRQLQASGCRTVSVGRIAWSALGIKMWTFWQDKYWCWTSPTITSVSTSGRFQPGNDPTWVYRGVVSSQSYFYTFCCSNNRSGHYTYRQALVEQCFVWCVQSLYPWVKIWAHGDSTFTYSTGGT